MTDLTSPRKGCFRTDSGNVWQGMFQDDCGMAGESSPVEICSLIGLCSTDGDVDQAAGELLCFVRL